MIKPSILLFRILLSISCLAGCASQVAHIPATFTPSAQEGQQSLKTLSHAAEIQLDTGYSRSLKAGSQWIRIGMIAQGEVYKPYKDVFTLEGAHIHEASLVIADGQLVGFYLPVERGFSPLAQKVRLKFN
jgi:hypothetical protein